MGEAKRRPAYSDDDPPKEPRWMLLSRVPSQVEASLLEGLLAEHDITCVVESVFFSQEPTNFGALGEFRVHVLEADWKVASELVRAAAESKGSNLHLDLV